jgi:hypothetical protein
MELYTYTLVITLLHGGGVIDRVPGLSGEECIGRAAAVDPGQAKGRCELVRRPDAPWASPTRECADCGAIPGDGPA